LTSFWLIGSNVFFINPILALIPYLISNIVIFSLFINQYRKKLKNKSTEKILEKFTLSDLFLLILIFTPITLFVFILNSFVEPIGTLDLGFHVKLANIILEQGNLEPSFLEDFEWSYPLGFHITLASLSNLFQIEVYLMSQILILFVLYLIFTAFTTISYIITRSITITLGISMAFFFIPQGLYGSSLFGTFIIGLGPWLLASLYASLGLLILLLFTHKNNFTFYILSIAFFLGILSTYPPLVVYFSLGIFIYFFIQIKEIKTKAKKSIKYYSIFNFKKFNFIHFILIIFFVGFFYSQIYEMPFRIIDNPDTRGAALGFSTALVFHDILTYQIFLILLVITSLSHIFYLKKSYFIAIIFLTILVVTTFSSFFPRIELFLVPLRMNYFTILFSWLLAGTMIFEINERLIKKLFLSESSLSKSRLKIIIQKHLIPIIFLVVSLIIFNESILELINIESDFYVSFNKF